MIKQLIIIFVITSSVILGQPGKKINSKVTEATVFKDRAMVTREAKVNLPAGKSQIIISELTSDLKDETVRVSTAGSGEIKILDINVNRRFTNDPHQENIKLLQSRIDSLKDIIQEIQDKITVLNSKKNFVESLKAESIKNENEKILLNRSSTKSWNEMLQFVGGNLDGIYKSIREQNQKKNSIEHEVNNLQSELNNYGRGPSKDYKEIVVNVETAQSGTYTLSPSYIVEHASWYPLYDARVASNSKEMELDYFGMIQQSTGEDWNEIKLTLSTAEPLSIKSIPELERWYLDIKPLPVVNENYRSLKKVSNFEVSYSSNYGLANGTGTLSGYVIDKISGEPLFGANVLLQGTAKGAATDLYGKFFIPDIAQGNYNIVVSYVGFESVTLGVNIKEKQNTNIIIPLNAMSIEGKEVVITAQASGLRKKDSQLEPKENNYTDVHAKELSTTFEIPAKSSVPSDNNPHKVTIAINKLPVTFEYTAIPKIVQKVYLKGKAVNTNSYPLLDGDINIFVDNDFINRTFLKTIVPSDTLELALGTDDKINIQRTLINKYTESKGLFGGSKTITYEYEIKITNNRTTEESILLIDQIPIAMNEDIKVTLLKPEKDPNELKNDRKIEWNLKLKPGETQVIPLKYSVSFPNNVNVYGFE